MRDMIFIFNVISILGCNSDLNTKIAIKDSSIQVSKSIVCDQNYDSLLLKYANEFVPTTIDLNGSLSSDVKSFLISVDTNCLRKQAEYKYFIALTLGKLALHHLKCCNQHYDLYQMREGAATIVINEFSRLAGYAGQRLEILNSGLIVDYILSDKTLSTNPTISGIMRSIEAETARIEKGI
jgi:hypothetical protein